jgi:catechol-2,3-dioxygenase
MTVGHIGINVNDIEVSKAFYMNLFDFEILNESREEGKKIYLFGKRWRTFNHLMGAIQ